MVYESKFQGKIDGHAEQEIKRKAGKGSSRYTLMTFVKNAGMFCGLKTER
jgi:hypothetical protein